MLELIIKIILSLSGVFALMMLLTSLAIVIIDRKQ